MYVCMHACMHVCMYVCIHTSVYDSKMLNTCLNYVLSYFKSLIWLLKPSFFPGEIPVHVVTCGTCPLVVPFGCRTFLCGCLASSLMIWRPLLAASQCLGAFGAEPGRWAEHGKNMEELHELWGEIKGTSKKLGEKASPPGLARPEGKRERGNWRWLDL